MRVVALISNPFRVKYCMAYLRAEPAVDTVMTSDPHVFSNHQHQVEAQLVKVTPPAKLLPAAKLARLRWSQKALVGLRTGSRLGRWLERVIKRVLWRLRYFDRLRILLRRGSSQTISHGEIRGSSIYHRLEEAQIARPIDRIVVFDVFDLPVALTFAEDYGVELLVR